MKDYHLYAHDRCDRCGAITSARTASFFTEDTICMACLAQESRLMAELRSAGVDVAILADCGYVPTARDGATASVPAKRWSAPAPDRRNPPITEADVRAALRRLRARSALVRLPPSADSSGRDLPPLV